MLEPEPPILELNRNPNINKHNINSIENIINNDNEVSDNNVNGSNGGIIRFNLTEIEFDRTLGTGSFGRVQLVRHLPSGRYMALKKLRKTEVIRLKQIEHTNSERRLLAAVRDHPFLVQLIGTAQDEGYLYVLMEYVSGGELFSLLRKVKTLPNFVAQFYAAQVILAFQHLHSQNIIYRDLKPENILITKEGNIKIVDFGFAKEVSDQTWTLCGTPDYLAPEIILSKGYGRAVDYYALGILIYEMLAGFPPFYHENYLKLYDNIVHAEVRFPNSFDPIARDLVQRLLEKNPSKRLGVQADGIEGIKNHYWFKDVNWDMLQACTIRAPYKPKINSEGDCSNFDIYPEETLEERAAASTMTIGNYSIDDMMNLFPDF